MGINLWVFLGDIKDSGKMENRHEVQEKLIEIFKELNREYETQLIANLAITRGDEFGCASENPVTLNRIGDELWLRTSEVEVKIGGRVKPFLFRYAIVYGEISAFPEKEIGLMDGPVFRTLDEKIKELKTHPGGWVYFEGLGEAEDNLFNAFKNLLYLFLANLSVNERKIVYLFHMFKSQKTIAKKLGVTQPYISKVLRKTNWQLVERCLRSFNIWLKHITDIGYRECL